MKTLVCLSMFALLSTLTAHAQKVPDHVIAACEKQFPGISEVEWEINKGFYLADFSHDDHYKTAKYDQAGKWLETRTYIEEDELPAPILKRLNEQYEDGYYQSIMKVENSKKESFYDVTMNVDDEVHLLIINLNGDILKSQVQKDIYEGESEDMD